MFSKFYFTYYDKEYPLALLYLNNPVEMSKQTRDGAVYYSRFVVRFSFCDSKASNWGMWKMLVLESF